MLAAQDLAVDIAGRRFITGAALSVSPGEVVALLGPNGAGKSTLLRALAGLQRIAGGRCTINGDDMARLAPARLAALRAVMTQEVAVFGRFRCGDIVALGRVAINEHPAAGARFAREAMTFTGTAHLANQPYDVCSGGEKQRVQLARVLAQLMPLERGDAARYLLLDEPIAALDPAYQLEILQLVQRLKAFPIGVLVVLHDINLAARFADRVVLMKAGAIHAAGDVKHTLTEQRLRSVYDTEFLPVQHPAFPQPLMIARRSDRPQAAP